MPASIRVNGVEQPLERESLGELLRRRGLDPAARGLAVAVNGAVVPRQRWSDARLSAGDDIEIVRPLNGG